MPADELIQLPHAESETERALLGSLILDPSRIAEIYDIFPPNCIAAAIDPPEWKLGSRKPKPPEPLFFLQSHQVIFGSVCRISESGGKPDLTLVSQDLANHGQLDLIGGSLYLASLEDDIFATSQAADYARVILNAWRKRAHVLAAQELVRHAADSNGSFDLLLDAHRERVKEIESESGSQRGFKMADLDRIFASPDRPSYLGDHLLQPGRITLLLGPPGIGKTRVYTQLITDALMGYGHLFRVFEYDWTSLDRLPRILVFQTENSDSRFKLELGAQMAHCSPQQRANVNANLLVYLTEDNDEPVLSLKDPSIVSRMTSSVKAFKPDIIVYDPYTEFYVGRDINTDDIGHTETIKQIERISKAANPQAAIIIVHHSLTGKAGAAKGVGWEGGGYARGGKALMQRPRAAINLIQADPDDRDVVVVACGKCSDGIAFDPFAIRLNPQCMWYEPEPAFDLSRWREEIGETRRRTKREAAADDKAAAVTAAIRQRGAAMAHKDLVSLICEVTAAGDRTAKRRIAEMRTDGTLTHNEKTGEYALSSAHSRPLMTPPRLPYKEADDPPDGFLDGCG